MVAEMNRRQFTKAAMLTPIGLALNSAADSQAIVAAAPLDSSKFKVSKHVEQKTAAEYNRHPPIHEPEPFASDLVFQRRQLALKLQAFALHEIQLDAGPLQQARDWNRGYMMRLPNDRLLYNFHVNAGIPSNAKPLGGWESPSSELRGHFVGHYLSASAHLYAATADTVIKKKADDIVSAIAQCQGKLNRSGYVSAFPVEFFERLDRRQKVWAPFYTLHKIMAGLFDMHVQAKNDQALDVLVRLASWADSWTASKSEQHMQDVLNTEFGGMNEVLYNLSAVTGDDRWARTGDRFTKKIFFTPLAMRRDALKGLHANTHIPQVVGAARRYELSSDPRFGDVSEFFWQTISEARTYVTGGSGNTESWLTNANHLSLEMQASSHHQECCCAYNMMKLTRHLYSRSGDARYIDYYERNLFNHRLGTIQPGTGLTGYFVSMSPGAWKTLCTEDQTFWCCTGTALEDFAKLNNTIYFHDDDGVYVNLYVSSRLDWRERGIHLQQLTSFPESDRTLIRITSSPSEEWTLSFRIPSWTTNESSLLINKRRVAVAGEPSSYLAIRRAWRDGDQVEVTMPMRLTAEPLSDDSTQQAFLYGPIVLAGQFPRTGIADDLMHNQGPESEELPPFHLPILNASSANPAEWIRPIPGHPLHFRTTGQTEDVMLKPFSQSWDRFVVYWKIV